MEGMLWAAAMMIGVPLAIAIGVTIVILRHRRRQDSGPGETPEPPLS